MQKYLFFKAFHHEFVIYGTFYISVPAELEKCVRDSSTCPSKKLGKEDACGQFFCLFEGYKLLDI